MTQEKQVYYSDETVLTCLFSEMESIQVDDDYLRVTGKLTFFPIIEGSVEIDTDRLEIDHNSGRFVVYIPGVLRRDSHPIKYKYKMARHPDDYDPHYDD